MFRGGAATYDFLSAGNRQRPTTSRAFPDGLVIGACCGAAPLLPCGRRMTRILGTLLVVVSVAGCTAASEVASYAQSSAAIVGGSPSTSADDAVVLIRLKAPNGKSCTAAFVAENVLVTAAHCVGDIPGGDIGCAVDGVPTESSRVVVRKPETLEVYAGKAPTKVATAKQIFVTADHDTCLNDIAYVVLDHKVDGAAIVPLRLEAPPVVGELVSFVGWGQSGKEARERKRRDGVPILSLGPQPLPLVGKTLTAPKNHIVAGEGICWGDSGGPMLAASGAVLGVSAKLRSDLANDSTYDECVKTATNAVFSLHTRVDRFRELAQTAFTFARTKPWLEGAEAPQYVAPGGACDAHADCGSGYCLEGDAPRRCASRCTEGTPCSAGSHCALPDGEEAEACLPDPSGPPLAATSTDGAPAAESCAVGAPGAPGVVAPWAAVLFAVVVRIRRNRRAWWRRGTSS